MNTQTPPGDKPRKARYDVQVVRVRALTPHMVRVTFNGAALANFIWSGPAAHIKLIFATASESARPVMRTYTPRRFDPGTRELDVDFVIHGEGPASAWAAQASVGQSLQIAGPGRSYTPDPTADWFILAGDETAIPALATLLEVLPHAADVRVFIEVADLAERAAMDVADRGARIHWLARSAGAAPVGQELEAALRRIDLPPGSGRVYVACEADAMRRIRRYLLTERGIPAAQLVTRGYWKQGETDHPDRDYGEDAG